MRLIREILFPAMNTNTVATEAMADEILCLTRLGPTRALSSRPSLSRRKLLDWQFVALVLCLMTVAQARAATVLGSWVPLFKGIDHAVGTNIPDGGSFPDLMVMNALRVDLSDPSLQFYTSPRYADYSVDNYEAAGYTATNFLVNNDLQVVINANYFHDPGTDDTESPDYTEPEGTPFDLIGLEISRGQVVSPQDSSDYTSTFMFATNNQVTFIPTNWPAQPTTGAYTAVTGLYPILLSNINVGSNYINDPDLVHQVNPRTAFGLSQDRRYLYMIVIDGRQAGYSDGALDWETAAWLQLLGASDGANMDGGGSSCMAMQDSTGAAIPLNLDSASAADGSERPVKGSTM